MPVPVGLGPNIGAYPVQQNFRPVSEPFGQALGFAQGLGKLRDEEIARQQAAELRQVWDSVVKKYDDPLQATEDPQIVRLMGADYARQLRQQIAQQQSQSAVLAVRKQQEENETARIGLVTAAAKEKEVSEAKEEYARNVAINHAAALRDAGKTLEARDVLARAGVPNIGTLVPVEKKEGDEWGDPYLDRDTGNLLQKNKTTGKVERIAAPPKGMVIESDGAGGFTFRTGVSGDELTKKTTGELEKKLTDGYEQVSRIASIATKFKPEYQEIGFRFGQAWTSLSARFGADVSEEDKQTLKAYQMFKRESISNINNYIKEMTGAQMSEKEANRLRLAQPDPGEKWYQGQDPISFKANMDDVWMTTQAAVARYRFYLNKGLSGVEIQKLINSDAALSLSEMVDRMKAGQ